MFIPSTAVPLALSTDSDSDTPSRLGFSDTRPLHSQSTNSNKPDTAQSARKNKRHNYRGYECVSGSEYSGMVSQSCKHRSMVGDTGATSVIGGVSSHKEDRKRKRAILVAGKGNKKKEEEAAEVQMWFEACI